MILEIENNKYNMVYEVFDEKISSLKRNKIIKIQIPLHSLAFDYFKSLTKIDKVKVSKHNYSWLFLNCTIDKIHLAPTKWPSLDDNKIVTIDIIFDDVIGSHSDELLKGKIRDKKLNELLKQSDK
jgi:hypothetical protein